MCSCGGKKHPPAEVTAVVLTNTSPNVCWKVGMFCGRCSASPFQPFIATSLDMFKGVLR